MEPVAINWNSSRVIFFNERIMIVEPIDDVLSGDQVGNDEAVPLSVIFPLTLKV